MFNVLHLFIVYYYNDVIAMHLLRIKNKYHSQDNLRGLLLKFSR